LTELGDWAEWGAGLDNLNDDDDDDDGDDDGDQAYKDLGKTLTMLRQMAGLASDICAFGGVVNCFCSCDILCFGLLFYNCLHDFTHLLFLRQQQVCVLWPNTSHWIFWCCQPSDIKWQQARSPC
jgi:hypothetical protein